MGISIIWIVLEPMSATTDADYKKEYTTFIKGLSSEFVKIYPSDSASVD